MQARLFNEINLEADSERALSQVYGLYCMLNGLVIIHLAIFAHYRPIISLAFSAVLLKFIFYISQAFYFQTITNLHNLVFPIVSCVVSLFAIAAIPYVLNDGQFFTSTTTDENMELFRQMKLAKKAKRK